MNARTKVITISLIVPWLAAIGVGFSILWHYENTAGAAACPPARLPFDSRIVPAKGQATLVMAAHPHCPCSRASIGELDLIMARCQERVCAYVLFLKPDGFSDEWVRSDLWDSAARIPGVTVLSDEGGAEAARFNAETSGATMLYDADGDLLFSGGVTGSRGHSGDNDGRLAIVALLTSGQSGQSVTPVFGCPLINTSTNPAEERLCNK